MLRRVASLIVTCGALVAPHAAAAAAAGEPVVSNWAGYVATRAGGGFARVSATWVEPAVTCTAGRPTHLAAWVGLGGNGAGTTALEQIGTDADCGADGRPSYSSWFELLPAVSIGIDLRIQPGDRISASVAVAGHSVRFRMADETRRTVFTHRAHAPVVDVSSADWILEAPALCATASDATCRDALLADFGSVPFSRARASSAGHSGAILDLGWSAASVALHRAGGGGGAAPTALTGAGDEFSVWFHPNS